MAENFRAIHPSELVDASWMKEKKKETASPYLLKHTRFETMVMHMALYFFDSRFACIFLYIECIVHL